MSTESKLKEALAQLAASETAARKAKAYINSVLGDLAAEEPAADPDEDTVADDDDAEPEKPVKKPAKKSPPPKSTPDEDDDDTSDEGEDDGDDAADDDDTDASDDGDDAADDADGDDEEEEKPSKGAAKLRDSLRLAMKSVLANKGRPAGQAILKKFGAAMLSDIKEKHLQAAIDMAKKAAK